MYTEDKVYAMCTSAGIIRTEVITALTTNINRYEKRSALIILA